MKRYLVFAGSRYYPKGGINDFQGDYDYEHDAVKYLDDYMASSPEFAYMWGHVYDTVTGEKVSIK